MNIYDVFVQPNDVGFQGEKIRVEATDEHQAVAIAASRLYNEQEFMMWGHDASECSWTVSPAAE